MILKVRITFTDGHRSWSVPGNDVPFGEVTVGDLADLPALEARLGRLTGLRVRIESETH